MNYLLQDVDAKDIKRFDVTKEERLSNAILGSLGNQVKWRHNHYYIKLNCLGYEGTAEVLVSWLLQFTNIAEVDYVKYHSCTIYEDDKFLGFGCYSKDYKGDLEEITVNRILDNSLASYAIDYYDLKDLLFNYVGFDTKAYLDRLLCLDAITRNEDRHFGNMGFLFDRGTYKPLPIYDNGASCLSDIITYPMSQDFKLCYSTVQAKPFKTNFLEQLHDVNKILIKYDDFLNSVRATTETSIRAFRTIKQGLIDTEGVAWERW